jgi:hypothetical protein
VAPTAAAQRRVPYHAFQHTTDVAIHAAPVVSTTTVRCFGEEPPTRTFSSRFTSMRDRRFHRTRPPVPGVRADGTERLRMMKTDWLGRHLCYSYHLRHWLALPLTPTLLRRYVLSLSGVLRPGANKVTDSMESAGSVKAWEDSQHDTEPGASEVRHSQRRPHQKPAVWEPSGGRSTGTRSVGKQLPRLPCAAAGVREVSACVASRVTQSTFGGSTGQPSLLTVDLCGRVHGGPAVMQLIRNT